MLAGDPRAAEEELRRSFESLSRIGEVYNASTIAARLAEALYLQDRDDEALAFSRKAEELAPEDDLWTQAAWRSVRAKVLARNGQTEAEALALAREAVEMLRATDAPVWRADGLCDFAEVLEACGQTDEARELLAEALELLERKGASVPAERTRTRLSRLAALSAAFLASG